MALDVSLSTPISDTLQLVSLEGEEALSTAFSFHLEFSSTDPNLDLSAALAQTMAVKFALPGGASQYLHGIVTSFGQGGRDATGTISYYARIEPWFALLRMNVDCRIFQNQSVPEIVEAVFQKLGLTDFKNSLTGRYAARDYCVQFGESTFDFLSRLMESEGIFYFFTFTASAHTLVLADDPSAFTALSGVSTIRFGQTGRSVETVDLMTGGGVEQRLVPAKVAVDDFNFVNPATDLYTVAEGTGGGNFAKVLSLYRYPGLYTVKSDGETVSTRELASTETPRRQLHGSSQCRAFHAGAKFTLAEHFNAALNTGYVLRSVTHRLNMLQNTYSNEFTAFPASATFRPPRITPAPKVHGSQTALVVGKSGETIWTDQYGRVKVKFHWDRATSSDETSSCWVRVAQGWAGAQWGSLFIPRIGQEVIVSFLDGNPDRPIVTGSVYNGTQTVPYALPDQQTRSTIKTSSSADGSKFNELRFEDKADAEEVFLRAQKDFNVSVLGDQTVTIANYRKLTVSTKDETHTIAQGNRTLEVTKGNETHTVGGTRTVTVTGDESHTSKAKFTHTVAGDYTLKVSGNLTLDVTGSIMMKAGTSISTQAGTSIANAAGTTISNQAQVSIESKSGAQHTVESSGILSLKGSLVKIN
jgi:type VI secretion system secreted protein VgrG